MEDLRLRRREIVIKAIAVILLAVTFVLSVTVCDDYFSDPGHYSHTLSALTDKEEQILKLTGACATAATLLAAVPDDATTPVADELADLASTFAIVLSVIFIEKYSLTLIGHVAFNYLFPTVCVCWIVGLLLDTRLTRWLRQWAVKLAIFGLIICVAIPFAMDVANLLEKTSDYKIEQTITEAEGISDEINENKDEDGNFFTKAWRKIKGGISGLLDRAGNLLQSTMETAAVLLATACIIPVAVVFVMAWAVKLLFGMQLRLPAAPSRRVSEQADRHEAEAASDGASDAM